MDQCTEETLQNLTNIISSGCPPNKKALESLKRKANRDLFIQDCKSISKNFNSRLLYYFIFPGYGMNETGLIAMSSSDGRKSNMTGKLTPLVKCRFVDQSSGNDITEPFKRGEIYISTPSVLKKIIWSIKKYLFLFVLKAIEKYLDNPEATRSTFTGDGWIKTGDVGYFDEENYIKIDDRVNDVITVGTKKVFSIDSLSKLYCLYDN